MLCFSSRRRHTRWPRDWSSDVCSSDLYENLGVIWYDAHGDINTTETSPSGNIHGMPLAVSLGYGHEKLTNILFEQPKIKPENVVLIGIRDLDEGEKERLRKLNIKVYTMHEIDRLGMPQVIEEVISYIKARTDGVHLSFEIGRASCRERVEIEEGGE